MVPPRLFVAWSDSLAGRRCTDAHQSGLLQRFTSVDRIVNTASRPGRAAANRVCCSFLILEIDDLKLQVNLFSVKNADNVKNDNAVTFNEIPKYPAFC